MTSQKPAPGALWEAVEKNDVKAAEELFRRGADANEENEECGLDLLMQATEKGYEEMKKLLLSHGAQYTYRPKAQSHDNSRAAAMVEEEAAHPKPAQGALLDVLIKKDAREVEDMLRRGADIAEEDEWGFDAIGLAACRGYTEIVRLLIEYDADINRVDRFRMTPLMWAAGGGNVETVRLLIESGADVAMRDSIGSMAQHKARVSGNAEIVQMLKEAYKLQRQREIIQAAHATAADRQQNLNVRARKPVIRKPQP